MGAVGMQMGSTMTTTIDSPGAVVAARGLPDTPGGVEMPEGTCSVEGCERPIHARGWCLSHYGKYRPPGVSGTSLDARRRPKAVCAVEGCAKPVKARGWCGTHYWRWRRNGGPLAMVRPAYGSGRRVTQDGYVHVYEPDHPLAMATGYVIEHRKVVYDAGIEVPDRHHVHHLNGVKDDNRLENLEVIRIRDHTRRHLAQEGYVSNQFGTFKVGSSRYYGKERADSAQECPNCGRLVGVRQSGRFYAHFCGHATGATRG